MLDDFRYDIVYCDDETEKNLLTDTYYFDTDCLSAFLWVRNESILAQLYPG